MSRVIVGMSGGVDSAVAASVLIEQGYDVEALFMKNWEEDSEYCTAEQDYNDALQVCDKLKIPLHTVNFVIQHSCEIISRCRLMKLSYKVTLLQHFHSPINFLF